MFSSIQEEIRDTIINVCSQRVEKGGLCNKDYEKVLNNLNKALEAAKKLNI